MITLFIELVFLTILLGSIVPLVQFVLYHYKAKNQPTVFRFSQKLFDMDMDFSAKNIKHTDKTIRNVNRFGLSDRGWIRCPNGTVMDDADFSRKKIEESEFELP